MNYFKWDNEVRAHEIDVQGIVNNAHYLSYLDHTRTLHLKSINIDWAELSQRGWNIILVETTLRFVNPLRAFQRFTVTSSVMRASRIKLSFHQEIKREETLICTAESIVVCVDSERNKPVALDKLEFFHF